MVLEILGTQCLLHIFIDQPALNGSHQLPLLPQDLYLVPKWCRQKWEPRSNAQTHLLWNEPTTTGPANRHELGTRHSSCLQDLMLMTTGHEWAPSRVPLPGSRIKYHWAWAWVSSEQGVPISRVSCQWPWGMSQLWAESAPTSRILCQWPHHPLSVV